MRFKSFFFHLLNSHKSMDARLQKVPNKCSREPIKEPRVRTERMREKRNAYRLLVGKPEGRDH
jgi:hypothetical protein